MFAFALFAAILGAVLVVAPSAIALGLRELSHIDPVTGEQVGRRTNHKSAPLA